MAVIGLDIGNITTIALTETKEIIMESRLNKATKINKLGSEDIFTYESQEYVTNAGAFENNLIKFEKENFLALMFYAIGKVTTSDDIDLVTGIPGKQYNTYKDKLKDFILNNSKKSLVIDGIARDISIRKITIVPEGYPLKTRKEVISECKKGYKTLVIDLGGGTSDTALFNEKFNFVDGDSITYGLLDLYRYTRKYINNEYNLNISLEDSKKYFDGELELLDGDNTTYKKDLMKEYIKTIVNELRGLYPNLKNMNIILTGGGSRKIYPTFSKLYPQTILVDDIKANAEGYRNIGVRVYD